MTKAKMIEVITGFETYPTMNSWNNSYGYSYNVKIHHLPLTSSQRDAAYAMLDTQEFYDFHINPVVNSWEDSEKVRSFGTHSEVKNLSIDVEDLTKKEIDAKIKHWTEHGWTFDRVGTKTLTMTRNAEVSNFSAGFNGRSGGHLVLYKWNGHNFAGTDWTHSKEELAEMSAEDVKFVYDVLRLFEKLYESLIETVKDLADNFEVQQEDYEITRTRNVLVEK